MPISPIKVQRRHAELGRIRLGNQVAIGNGRSRPNKLDRFRFTSTSERLIRDVAELFGGEAKPWDNGGKPEWEVFTDAQDIGVVVIKGGLSQWMEFWSGGGCLHRCDGTGEMNMVTGDPCDLTEKVTVGRNTVNPHEEAKPTTRLAMMIPELATIGAWRMETHGWNAAAEIPAIAELAQFVGDMVPARLYLQERRSVKDGETNRFVVPVLDLQIGQERLREIVNQKAGLTGLPGGSAPALESPSSGAAALPAGSGAPPAVDDTPVPTLDDIEAATAENVVYSIYNFLKDRGLLTDELDAACKARVEALKATAPPAAAPDEDGAVDAEIVDDGDADAVWQQILLTAGKQGLSEGDVKTEFAAFTTESLATAPASLLEEFHNHLKAAA